MYGLGAVALTGAVALAAGLLPWRPFTGPINTLGVDLARPAAYLSTPSLSALPRDLVKAPVLREVLTEDFAFYYEDHEDRLGLNGALRRIAFEHDTTLADNLLALALDEASEVALWTDAKGAPRHWAIAMSRSAVSKALQGLAAVAAKDRQLTLIGEVKAAAWGGSAQPVYALQLSSRRTLALAARGNRLVVLSDPGLLFDNERKADTAAVKVLDGLLSGDSGTQGLWRQHFGLTGAPAAHHSLVAGAGMLSFGYQQFFPSLQALRVEVDAGGQQLRSFVRRAGGAPAGASPWPALPARAAACALLPVDWARAKAVVPAGHAALADAVDGPAGICWYDRSQLHTPLLVAHARGAAPTPDQLAAFTKWWLPAAAAPANGTGPGMRATIAAPYGPLRDGDNAAYQTRFARVGDWWLFSPDAELVDQAQATIARRYPSQADTLGDAGATLALAVPAQMAEMFRREALAVITPQQAAFRQAAETQLLPRLAAFAKLPAVQAVPRGTPDAQGWQPLDWRTPKAVPR
jgi:uncharacterized protein YfaA (DUF2138 family)